MQGPIEEHELSGGDRVTLRINTVEFVLCRNTATTKCYHKAGPIASSGPYLAAMTSISTGKPPGISFTATQERAGSPALKKVL